MRQRPGRRRGASERHRNVTRPTTPARPLVLVALVLTNDSLSNRLLYGYGATRTGHILTKDASPYLTP